jgi:tRNA dimethylallyltransferase
MVENGLIKEVEQLIPHQQLNALQTVGYSELFSYFNKEIPLPQAIEKIKQHTRNYAKRQMTWFKKDLDIKELPLEELLKYILK